MNLFSKIIRNLIDYFSYKYANIYNLKPLPTGEVIKNLYSVRTGAANFYLYSNGDKWICFDSGYNKNAIFEALDSIKIDIKSISHMFLTNLDFDHSSGINLFQNAKIYVSAIEDDMVTHFIKRGFRSIFNRKIKMEHSILHDGDIVKIDSIKVQAIMTPGHTNGSMSFLLNNEILFTGDAFTIKNSKVYPIRWYINMDTRMQIESSKKLSKLNNIKYAFTSHSGYTKFYEESMKQWNKN